MLLPPNDEIDTSIQPRHFRLFLHRATTINNNKIYMYASFRGRKKKISYSFFDSNQQTMLSRAKCFFVFSLYFKALIKQRATNERLVFFDGVRFSCCDCASGVK